MRRAHVRLDTDLQTLPANGPMRCTHCDFDNVPGVTICQVCGSQMPTLECSRCHFVNPPYFRYCGSCGLMIALEGGPETTVDIAGPAPEPTRKPDANRANRVTSPVALVGFGAILALASAAFPWYLLGSSSRLEEQTLSDVLESGWQWFPGVPLVLIVVSAVLSALIAVGGNSSKLRPIIAIGSGLATLLAAAWLWQGYPSSATDGAVNGIVPGTGVMLILMGAIVLVATLLWMFRSFRFR